MYDKERYLITSDTSLLVEFGNEISTKINSKIRAFELLLESSPIEGITETVPTYRSVLIHYMPEVIGYDELVKRLKSLMENMKDMEIPKGELIEVPVVYGGIYGPDLEFVAKSHGLTPDEVIKRHTAPEYLIYMLGFTPGFCYMGGMDETIATPRLKTPRVSIPAGSVGIAGSQTGIYPIASPGGWQLIGRTPLVLYDHRREKPVFFEAGQRVKFVSITEDEFRSISEGTEGVK